VTTANKLKLNKPTSKACHVFPVPFQPQEQNIKNKVTKE